MSTQARRVVRAVSMVIDEADIRAHKYSMLDGSTASLSSLLTPLGTIAGVVLAGSVLLHLILSRRDSTTAIAWAGIILLLPLLGPVLYYLFGINRVRRRAGRLQGLRRDTSGHAGYGDSIADDAAVAGDTGVPIAVPTRVGSVVRRPLEWGNRILPLGSGAIAFEDMLAAIDGAERSVALSSYIFNADRAGDRFIAALIDACARGVEVRVLVDGVGACHHWPQSVDVLTRNGVPAERFLFSLVPWRMPYLNLRNHAKILVVDGRIGYSGGMNILDACLPPESDPTAGPEVADVHFRIEGPAVGHMMERFADDWYFTTSESLTGETWFPSLERRGDSIVRIIDSGPDFAENPWRWALLSAITSARRRIRIVTPYFLPDRGIMDALKLAVAAGVEVEVILPWRLDYRMIEWASAWEHQDVLAAGCRLYLGDAPFDHAKLMTVDGTLALLGSGNWDSRSLRLNFEFALECYDPALVADIDRLIADRRLRATEVDRSDVADQPLGVRIRNGIMHLAKPYL